MSVVVRGKHVHLLLLIFGLFVLCSKKGAEFFTGKLLEFCHAWLKDSVYAVRISTIENLSKIVKVFGQNWVQVMNARADFYQVF
eukprot:m.47503 g.47503  ORF g.47503 m.47503 type:complete len:84 (+) comp10769_c0_seq2:1517-1768(+)